MTEKGLRKITEDDVGNIIDFIRDTIETTGCEGTVVGLSGGIDSAVVTKMCADAIGGDRVLNIFMPTSVTQPDDYRDTMELSKLWGTRYKVVEIQRAVDAFTATLFTNVPAPLEKGNISARCRMVVLYNNAKKTNYLVAGTSNKSELMMGYFTKFGDGACDLCPMANLYKTQVWEAAKILGVPEKIIDKVPTAGLWEGQTDEVEMGITYKDLDIVLDGISKGRRDAELASATGVPSGKVAEIRAQIAGTEHKRHMPAHPEAKFT